VCHVLSTPGQELSTGLVGNAWMDVDRLGI